MVEIRFDKKFTVIFSKLKDELTKLNMVHEIIECKPGHGPRVIEEHLF